RVLHVERTEDHVQHQHIPVAVPRLPGLAVHPPGASAEELAEVGERQLDPREVALLELQEPGLLLHDHRELRGWKGSYTEGEGYLLGLLVGDGTLKADKAVLSVWNPETRAVVNGSPEVAMPGVLTVMQTALEYAQALPHRADFRGWMAVPGRTENRMSLGHVKKLAAELGMSPGSKDITPVMERASSDFYRGFLRGFFDSDGSVQGSQTKGVSVRLAQSDRDRLLAVQRMLLRLGIASTVYEGRRPPQLRLLPDQHGGRKWYPTVEQHELAITGENILRFAEVIGFSDSDKALKLRTLCSAYKRAVNRERFTARVASVTASGTEDVYDVQIPGIHAFDANGFFAHNCGEQPLLPNEACNLGSLNLARFVRPYRGIHEGNGREKVDWAKMEEVVRFSVRFLDNVIDVNPYPLKDIDEMVKANRRIGLGIMGWSDMLILLDIPYDSEEALLMAQKVMSFIKEKGHDESSCLARERGYFPNWPRSIFKADRPLRNSTVTTVAPTGTISIIAGCSSGIEPLFAVAYSHIVGDRHLRFINPHFERIARERGFYAEELMEKVARLGTVQGLPEVPLDVQRLFKTAHDIPPEWHVRTQAAFQKSTDNGVSKTINLPNSATTDDVANAYLLAHDLGCLGITVFRDGCKEGQVLYKGTEGAVKGEGKETKVKPRPRVVQGVTYRINTPIGTAFITVNDNGSGEPFEVFANVGKAGSDIAAVAEATGRLMSLCLRLPSTLSARERLREIINQLSGIGGGRQMGFGKDRIRSLPDAVATVLAEHMGLREEVGDEGEEEDGGHLPLHLDLCPDCGHATLVFEEGCQKCHTCGYSMC
ncbi:MAG: ribonucleoside reductase class II, partial [Armatimonadetes bacterium]|nr:ribonucleoside reductase class II [Armatimonadota bacterium]